MRLVPSVGRVAGIAAAGSHDGAERLSHLRLGHAAMLLLLLLLLLLHLMRLLV
jgi:hypothetical protein